MKKVSPEELLILKTRRSITLQWAGRYFVNIPAVFIKQLKWIKGELLSIEIVKNKIFIKKSMVTRKSAKTMKLQEAGRYFLNIPIGFIASLRWVKGQNLNLEIVSDEYLRLELPYKIKASYLEEEE